MNPNPGTAGMETNEVPTGVPFENNSGQEAPWINDTLPYYTQVRNPTLKNQGRGSTKHRRRGLGKGNQHQTPSRGGYAHYPATHNDASWRPAPSKGRGQQSGRGYH